MSNEQVLAQEVLNLVEAVGELRLNMNALWQRLEKLERLSRTQTPQEHAEALKGRRQRYVGSVAGFPWEVTVTGTWVNGIEDC